MVIFFPSLIVTLSLSHHVALLDLEVVAVSTAAEARKHMWLRHISS